MPANPADRAATLLASGRDRLAEAAAIQANVCEMLLVAHDAIARSHALVAEFDRMPRRPERRGEGTTPRSEDDGAAHR